MDEQRKVGGSLRENTNRYRVDGEIGRIEFKTHSLISENDEKIIFNTAKDVFRTLMSKEWYRTKCFDEIVFDSLTDTTYRKTSKRLNRMRWQGIGGTPAKTLANIVDTEGRKIEEFINELTGEIFNQNDFSAEGIPNNESDLKIDIGEVHSFIENPERTVNISVDDVSVKKQKIKRNVKWS